jgi:hypothetical protein
LFNLNDFLPKKPGEVELKVMKEMFEASVDGEAFDLLRWGQYFKPAGMGGSGSATGSASTAPAAKAAPAPAIAEDEDDIPFETTPTAPAASAGGDAGNRAADIISMIRSRQKTA